MQTHTAIIFFLTTQALSCLAASLLNEAPAPSTIPCKTNGDIGKCVDKQQCKIGYGHSIACPKSSVCCFENNQIEKLTLKAGDLTKLPIQVSQDQTQNIICTTKDGEKGECVQNYLCDRNTNMIITDGSNIIDRRIFDEPECPLPMVCCKVAETQNSPPQPALYPGDLTKLPIQVSQDQTQNIICTTKDGEKGECVQNYLCDRNTNMIITDGSNIIDRRIFDEPECPLPMVCCKVAETQNSPPQPALYPGDLTKLPIQVSQDQTQYIICTTKDGEKGECVQNYLCDRNTNMIITDGSNIIDRRIFDEPECPLPMVCCKVAETQNSRPQPALYPYLRVPRDMTKIGCGWRNPDGVSIGGKINPNYNNLGEEYAKPGEFPWTVSVVKLQSRIQQNADFAYLGAGALIHERAVLTAAHIFPDKETLNQSSLLYVVVGDYDQNSINVLPRKVVHVKSVDIHNKYNENLFNDIALVILSKPVLVSGHVNYICLPPTNVVEVSGSRCFSSGWGKNGYDVHQYILNKAELSLVDRKTCQTQLRQIPQLRKNFILHPSFMCAGGENRKDSCKGSGGSPLVCPMQDQSDRYVLSGLVSWSNNCSFDGLPSVYASVSNARQWIDDKMAANGYQITSV